MAKSAMKGTKQTGTEIVAKPPVPKKKPTCYFYEPCNEGLPVYGVLIQWESKTKYTNKMLQTTFEGKLASIRSGRPEDATAADDEPVRNKSSLKRKPAPHFRRVGPKKGIMLFDKMEPANEFARMEDPEFYAFIPLSFVSTIGMVVFNMPRFKCNELQQYLPDHKVLQWRRKRKSNKTHVSFAVRGTSLPKELNFKGELLPVQLCEREPVHCGRCQRYGHRTSNCLRKPRCGACIESKPASRHLEKSCSVIRKRPTVDRCIDCRQSHDAGSEGCAELGQQKEFKMELVRHKMDYLSVLEAKILPGIRTTAINSNRIWLD